MPWDRDILRRGEWQLNPEYAEELAELPLFGPTPP